MIERKYELYFYRILSSTSRRYGQKDQELESFLIEKWVYLKTKIDWSNPEAKIKTYIRTSISGYAKNYFRDHARLLKIPRSYQLVYQKAEKFRKKNPEITIPEICELLNISPQVYHESLFAYGSKVVPYKTEVSSSEYDSEYSSEQISLVKCLPVEDREKLEDLYEGATLEDIYPNLSSKGQGIIKSLKGNGGGGGGGTVA